MSLVLNKNKDNNVSFNSVGDANLSFVFNNSVQDINQDVQNTSLILNQSRNTNKDPIDASIRMGDHIPQDVDEENYSVIMNI